MRKQDTPRPGFRRGLIAAAAAVLAMLGPVGTAHAQIQTVDPDTVIDGDLQNGTTTTGSATSTSQSATGSTGRSGELPPKDTSSGTAMSAGNGTPLDATPVPSQPVQGDPSMPPPASPTTGSGANWNTPPYSGQGPTDTGETYHEDDLIGAAEGVFGKGAQGLADLIKDLLKKQGEPNAYIVGREAGGAIGVGLRYGSGTLYHKVEGQRPVYWTGPSIGFDAGANAASTFVLVYNLYDTQDLYKRYGAGEGQAYLIGGFNVSYLRRGDTVLVAVRAGAGLRLGANIGYMKFSEKQRWLPF